MTVLRAAVSRTRRPPSHLRRQARRLVCWAGGRAGAGAAAGSGGGIDGPSTPASDVTPATSTGVAPPSSNALAWGAVASATVAVAGLNYESRRDNDLWRHQLGARGYHSSVARCESDKPNPSRDNAKADSFFDMAQQWASDLAESKKKTEGATAAGESSQTPEDLLESIGILGGGSEQEKSQADEDGGGSSGDGDEPSNLKGMMQKVWSKFDDMQSSLPKSSSTKDEADDATDDQAAPDEPGDDGSSKSLFSDLLSFADKASLFTRKSSTQPPDLDELIQQAQSIANSVSSTPSSGLASSQDTASSSGFLSQVLYFQQNAKAIQRAFETSFGPYLSKIDVDDFLSSMPIAAMHYYLEHQDSIKTPSWKRRMHRFQQDVEVLKVEELNEALILSELSYSDTVEEIRDGLEKMPGGKDKPRWELLFCDTESRPNEPGHFLAIQKNASPYDDALRVLMVVRGTKSMSDLMTDALLDATEYSYAVPGKDGGFVIEGEAHSGMVGSGKYLVKRHQKLLQTLLELSKKRKLEITLIGHSLGAGAATIAAMEWKSNPFEQEREGDSKDAVQVSAHVIGFGCPALLSRPLSLATKYYVTTVIADADFIPRMSGVTLVNLLLDLKSFDYQSQAERDVEQALRELQGRFSGSNSILPGAESKSKFALSIDEDDIQSVLGYVHRGLEKVTGSSSEEKEKRSKLNEEAAQEDGKDAVKLEPALFPPGKCIHFYRDGSGISGTYVPCDFFNEIDVAWTMIDDHLISSGYRKIFLSLMRDFYKDDHFSFSKEQQPEV